MATHSSHADFEALARRYWSAWGEWMRGGAASAAEQSRGREGLDGWTRFVRAQPAGARVALERFDALARDWYGAMRQLAERFAGQDASAEEIAGAWRQALGGRGAEAFAELFRSMRGQGQQGLDAWLEAAAPTLQAWKDEGLSWLRMPAFGFARGHQERWQALAAAQLELQERMAAYNVLLMKAGERAHEVFETKLAGRTAPEARLKSVRALFDLWIDAAEEAYAEVALSPEFREVYGALVDAQMRVRAGVQDQVERMAAQFGMPTRTEADAAHRKIVELERQVRRLRDAIAASGQRPASPSATGKEDSRMARSSSSPPSPPRTPSARVADGSNKLAGDPITGPRRGAAPPEKRAVPAAPAKAGPDRAVRGKPSSKPAPAPTRKRASKAASKPASKAAPKAGAKAGKAERR
jgi:class III poly(R)-hydroxyalkanoic acid synthase PhaE subunit